MEKALPIGVSDFREIIEHRRYYVDKSLLIKELLDSGSKAILITRPRRFGKTLNLSMLRYYFEKTEEATSSLFRHLAIWQQGEKYTQHQAQYPVVYLTFKDVKCPNWVECEEEFRRVISSEFRRHQHILEGSVLDLDEKAEYHQIIARSAGSSAYRNSIKNLTAWLERFHNRRVVVLIDEYDTPIQQGYQNGYYDDVINFMRFFLGGALKDNNSLEKGVLTGILRVAKESIFSGLNNLEVCTLLATPFSTHFGLLESEVEEMLAYYQVGLDMEQVKGWYNGYIFGDTTVYNPWSILNFTKDWQSDFRPYWINTSSNDLIRMLLTRADSGVKEDMERLLQGETIRKEIHDDIVFREIDRRADALWNFLLFSGYLKIVTKEMDQRMFGHLMIPNREVAYLFEGIVMDWFRENMDSRNQDMMLNALVTGEIETFQEIFQDYVMDTFSVFDTGGKDPEKVYHAFVLGLLVHLRSSYEVKSNRESGFGRYDVLLIPRNPTAGKGVIIEFKKVRHGETMASAAASALQQIEAKRYAEELIARGIPEIIKMAIVFAGKEVLVETL